MGCWWAACWRCHCHASSGGCGSCLGGRCCSGSTGCLAFICCSSSRCARRRLCRPIINYLWPLGMVVLAPLVLPGLRWRASQVGAAVLGFAGAAVVILGRSGGSLAGGWHSGCALALGSALVWSTYSLGTRRVAPLPPTRWVRLQRCRVCSRWPAMRSGRGRRLERAGPGADRAAGAGAAGRGVLPVGCGAQGGRPAPHRAAGLPHATAVHRRGLADDGAKR